MAWPHPGAEAESLSNMQALPIFLDRIVDPVIAIVLSVTAVLLFGKYCL